MISEPTTCAIKCDGCGDKIEAGEDFLILDLDGETYHFCSRDCLDDFIDENITPFDGQASEDYINRNGFETTERNSGWGMYYDQD